MSEIQKRRLPFTTRSPAPADSPPIKPKAYSEKKPKHPSARPETEDVSYSGAQCGRLRHLVPCAQWRKGARRSGTNELQFSVCDLVVYLFALSGRKLGALGGYLFGKLAIVQALAFAVRGPSARWRPSGDGMSEKISQLGCLNMGPGLPPGSIPTIVVPREE